MRVVISWGIFVLVVLGAFFVLRPLSVVVVDGESMEPTYRDDDLVFAYERGDYEIGDVIVYDANVSGQFNVVHRIVAKEANGFTTQGDNVPNPDYWTAEPARIHGAAFMHIPGGGGILMWLRQPFVIFSLLMGWAGFEFMKAREKEKEQRQETHAGQTESV